MTRIRLTHLMEKLYRRQGKRAAAVLTLACFCISSVMGPAAGLAADLPDTRPFDRLRSEFVLPYTLGRITDAHYAGSGKVVIVVQDLHCHPEVQKNISSIIASLDKRYGIANVYLEGAAGQLDTSWLLSLSDAKLRQAVVASLMRKGQLTGAEHYSVTANRPRLILGLEDQKAYDENVFRLDGLLRRQAEISTVVAGLKDKTRSLEDMYWGAKNKRLERALTRYHAGGRDAAQFYGFLKNYAQKNGIDPYAYENLSGYLDLLNFERGLRYPKIAAELQSFLALLKGKLPYRDYQALVEKTGSFSKLDELYLSLARLSRDTGLAGELERGFPELAAFFRYVSLSQKINPVNLVREERKLIGAIRTASAENESEREVVFLADFLQRLEDYFTNRISAEDYRYYADHRGEFDLLWDKYADKNDLAPLAPYTALVDEFYRVNVERNGFFLRNILASGGSGTPLPAVPGDDLAAALASLDEGGEAVMAVAGGFHTAGLTALLKENGISYLVITPNVTQDARTADTAYTRTMAEYVRLLGATLSTPPASVPALRGMRLIAETLSFELGRVPSSGQDDEARARSVETAVKKALEESGNAPDTFSLESIGANNDCRFSLTREGRREAYLFTAADGLIWPAAMAPRRSPSPQALGRNVRGLVRLVVAALEGAITRSAVPDTGQVNLHHILTSQAVSLGDKYFYLLAGAEGEKLVPAGGEEAGKYRAQLERMGRGFREMGFAMDAADVNLSTQELEFLVPADEDMYGLGTLRVSPLTMRPTAVIHQRFLEILEIVGPLAGKKENDIIDDFVAYEGMQYRALNEPGSKEYLAFTRYLHDRAKERTGRELSEKKTETHRTANNFQSFIRSLAALPVNDLRQASPLHQRLATLEALLNFADDSVLIDQTLRLFQQHHPGRSDTLVKEAIRIAAERYGDKSFPSGERYLHHTLTVARNAAKYGADEMTIAAAVLHKLSDSEARDVFSKRSVKHIKALHADTAETVLRRMEKLARISKLPYIGDAVSGLRGGFTLQNYMNMVVKLAGDDQTMLLVFADRLQTFPQTVDPAEKEYRRQEIEQVYVPLAMRLDAYDIAEDLRNQAFFMYNPREYSRIKREVEDYLGTTYEQAELMLRSYKDEIMNGLRARGIESAVVKVRVKTPYSVWEKVTSDRRKEYSKISSLKDILGIHIVVDDAQVKEALDFIDSWLHNPARDYHNNLPNEEDPEKRAEKMKQYRARPIVPADNKQLNRYRYNFADARERSYEVVVFGANDYAQLQSGFLDETSVTSPMPHWIYKLGEKAGGEDGVFIQRLSFRRFTHKEAGDKGAETAREGRPVQGRGMVNLLFRSDNIRYTGDFRADFNALRGTLDDKIFVMFYDEDQRIGVVSLPERAIPADLAAHVEIDRLTKNYYGLEKMYLVKHGENPVRESRPRHALLERPDSLQTGDIVTPAPQGPGVVPTAQIIRNARTPRAILLATISQLPASGRQKLIETGKRMISKESGRIDDELLEKLKYFRRSRGLQDMDELYLAVAQGIIETDDISRFLRISSRRVVELVARKDADVAAEAGDALSAMGFRVTDLSSEDYTGGLRYFRFVVQEKDPAGFVPSNGHIEQELRKLAGVEDAAVKKTQTLYLSVQALGHRVYSLLVSLYGIEIVMQYADILEELLIGAFEKQLMAPAETAQAGYAESIGELQGFISRDPDQPLALVAVSRNPELIRKDAWVMATMEAQTRTDERTQRPVIARTVLYVHEAFFKALHGLSPPERREMLRLLAEHEIAEFRALNLPGSEEYDLFTAYLRGRFSVPDRVLDEYRNGENFHEMIYHLQTKGTLSVLESRLAAQAALLDWGTEVHERMYPSGGPLTGSSPLDAVADAAAGAVSSLPLARSEGTRMDREREQAAVILEQMQRSWGSRRVIKEGLIALLELTVETAEIREFILTKLREMKNRLLREGSRDNEKFNLLYALEIVSDRFNDEPFAAPPEYERTDGPKFKSLLSRLMIESGREELSPEEQDEVKRFCAALEEIPGALAPVVADIRYPNLCGPSAQIISEILKKYGIPARKTMFSGPDFGHSCVETKVAGFMFYVDGTGGHVANLNGRRIAPVVTPHRDVANKRIGIYLSRAEGGVMQKQAVDGMFFMIELDRENADLIREVRDLRIRTERPTPAARSAKSPRTIAFLRSLLPGVPPTLRPSRTSWEREFERLIDKHLDKADVRTRDLLKKVEAHYRDLKTGDFEREIGEIAAQVDGVPGVNAVYGLGFPFYGRYNVKHRNYTTLKAVDERTGRLSEFAQRLLPDIDMLLVIEGSDEGPWNARRDIDSAMMDAFLQQASGDRRKWRALFDRLAAEYPVINKYGSEGSRDPIDLFLEEGKLNVDFVPVVGYVWANMPVMVLSEDMQTFKFIRDLLFTAVPLASRKGAAAADVPLQFRRNFMLNLMREAGTPLTGDDIIARVIAVHPYHSLITAYPEVRAHVSDIFDRALRDAESRGLVERGADDTYALTAEGGAFLSYILKKRREILEQGYLDMPPYSESMLPSVAAPRETSPASTAGTAVAAAADPRRVLVGEAAAQAAERLAPSSPDWMRENAPEVYGKTALRYFDELDIAGMDDTAALNALGMNGVCVLPYEPDDAMLPAGKITVRRPDGRRNIRLAAGRIETGDGRSFGVLCGEDLRPEDCVQVAAWLKGLPERRRTEIARLLGLPFGDIDVRIVEFNGDRSLPDASDGREVRGVSFVYRPASADGAPAPAGSFLDGIVPKETVLLAAPVIRAQKLIEDLYLPQILRKNALSVTRAGTNLGETVMPSALRDEDARRDSGIGELKDLLSYFVKKLLPSGMDVMQLLPLTPPAQNSPLEAADLRAGDYALIDCSAVPEVRQLVSRKDPVAGKLRAPDGETSAVDRAGVSARKFDVLAAARSLLGGEREARFREYARKEGYWLDAYARRMAAAKVLGLPAVSVTPEQIAGAEKSNGEAFAGLADTFRYMQWLFDAQLKDTTARLAERGGKVYFWATIGGDDFEEALRAVGYWFAAYGFDGVRLSVTDPVIAASPEKLQRIKDAVNRARPGAVVSVALPDTAPLSSELLDGFGFLRVRSCAGIAPGEKIAPNDVVEMSGTHLRPHAGARAENLIDLYTERLGRAREAVCVLFTLGDLFGDDRTLADPDRQGKDRWSYRVPLDGEVSEERVKSSLSGLAGELLRFSAFNRNLSVRRGYETAAALFAELTRTGDEHAVLQKERQFEMHAQDGSTLTRIREPGLHAALAAYRYLVAHPVEQDGILGYHAPGSDRSFFALAAPVLEELSGLPGGNRKYWKAALAHVAALERQAREADTGETKLRCTLEMLGFVRGALEQVLENEDRKVNLPPAEAAQRAARRALLCAADACIVPGAAGDDPARVLEKARLLTALNRFGEARAAFTEYLALARGARPGEAGTEQFLEFVELMNVYARRAQDDAFVSSLAGEMHGIFERHAVDETASPGSQALYYNALKVFARLEGGGAFAERAAASRSAFTRAYDRARGLPVTSGALYVLGLSETGDLLSREEKESLMRRIDAELAGAAGLRHAAGAAALDPSLVGRYIDARIRLFGRRETEPEVWGLVNPLLDVALRLGALPDLLPLDSARELSSARPVAELLRILDLFSKPELSSPGELEEAFRNAVKPLDIRSQKAIRGAA